MPSLEIVFVLALSQNRFFFEMVEALIAELQELGVRSSLSTNGFPPRRRGLVYAVFPPHEYFVLEGHDQRIDESILKHTIFISAEQPASSHFADNVRLSEFAGRVFDINAAGIRAYQRHGVSAELLQLGYSRHFDRFKPVQNGGIDVLFMGCATPRRLRVLASCARVFSSLETKLVLSDNSRPNSRPSANFVTGEDKLSLLQRSATLLNIHQAEDPYFEWARVLDAIHCGAVVITEHSTDHGPLIPGEHFVSCRPEAVPLILEQLNSDSDLRDRIRRQAYDRIRSDLRLSTAAELLASAAEDIDSSLGSATAPNAEHSKPASVDDVTHIDFEAEAARYRKRSQEAIKPRPLFQDSDPELSAIRRVLKEVRLDMMDLRRSMTRNALLSTGEDPPLVKRVMSTAAYSLRSRPRVTILTALFNHGSEIREALNSLLESHFTDWEIIVVNDGSTDMSLDQVRTWADQHPEIALLLLSHPVNRGLGAARNTALEHARGEYVFVLDSDNAVYPNAIGDLVQTLDSHPEASFAYGILASFRDLEPYSMLSFYPWEPERFRSGNYIDAMALFRADRIRFVGGYSTDRRLFGWEDYDVYCRFAEADHQGAFLDRIVASYRSSETSMLSVTNISHTTAYVALKEHAPKLLENLVAPE
jgi:hypothetical protein